VSCYTDYAIPVFYEHGLKIKKIVCFQKKSDFWPAFLQSDTLCIAKKTGTFLLTVCSKVFAVTLFPGFGFFMYGKISFSSFG
jgi:hypothetical protein